MNKYIILKVIFIALLGLSGCSSSSILDKETQTSSVTFKTYWHMEQTFKNLEKRIDNGSYINRHEIHNVGFNPTKTPIAVINYLTITNIFTMHGNEVAASHGINPPSEIIACAQKGKSCTAYMIGVKHEQSIEKPKTRRETSRSLLGLQETHYITQWKYAVIIVFDSDQAVYSIAIDNEPPATEIHTKKNSFWKKLFSSITRRL
ncbi:MAG: hypothetical protein ACI9TY_001548 [Alphaproteobacteria bacterium]|jgi:hypothetical protein